MRTGLFALVVALLLGGCSILPESPRVALYTPPLQVPAAAGQQGVQWRLALSRPAASGLLGGARILVHPVPTQIEVYPQAEWSAPPPELVGNALLHAFEGDARVPALQRSSAGLGRDFELTTELRAFQLELANGPSGVVRIKANLLRQPDGRLVEGRLFEAVVPAEGEDVGAAVNALGAGLQQVLSEIVDWTVTRAEQDWQRHADAKPTADPISVEDHLARCTVDADHCVGWRGAAIF